MLVLVNVKRVIALNNIVLFYLYYKLLGSMCKIVKLATVLQNQH